MRRGEVVVVAVPGDYGKPRPAVVIQSNAIQETDSILLCLLTSTLRDASLFRLRVEPTDQNGLHAVSDIMIEKVVALKRERINATIGRLPDAAMAELNLRLAIVLGLADPEG